MNSIKKENISKKWLIQELEDVKQLLSLVNVSLITTGSETLWLDVRSLDCLGFLKGAKGHELREGSHIYRCVILHGNGSRPYHMVHSSITRNDFPDLAAGLCTRRSMDVVVNALTVFFLRAPYLSILVLSQKPGFRETQSYFGRQHIALSEEVM